MASIRFHCKICDHISHHKTWPPKKCVGCTSETIEESCGHEAPFTEEEEQRWLYEYVLNKVNFHEARVRRGNKLLAMMEKANKNL